MATVPALWAVARPVPAFTVATALLLEPQTAALMVAVPTVADSLVRLTVAPDDVVPMAMNCAVWPTTEAVCVAGTIASETRGSAVAAMFTLRVAVAVTAVPSGLYATAVITVIPEV